jgi:hypothetical protein
MFPRFREQIGTALDLFVEFSTLGEYRLAAEGPLGAASAPADAPGHQVPQLGGARAQALRTAVRRTVAGGPAGAMPVATPAARRLMEARQARITRPAPCHGRRRGAAPAGDQLCLAV